MADHPISVLHLVASTVPTANHIDLVRQLQATGTDVQVCALMGGGDLSARLAPPGIEVTVLGKAGLSRSILAAGALRGLVRSLRPDILHVNQFVPGVVAGLHQITPGLRPPLVLTRHHDRSHHLLRRPLHIALDRWSARRASVVIAPSAAVRKTLVEEEGIPERKVRVIHHGLDWDRVHASPTAIEAWRERLGEGPWAVTAARLDPVKRFGDLFAAFAMARDLVPSLRLAVAGGGSQAARTSTEALAELHGVSGSVRFLGHVDDIHALMTVADVYVQASASESFGLSVLEAIGLGTPIAVTTPGGVAEVVASDQPHIAPGDITALGRRIAFVIGETGARAQTARAAERVRMQFSAERAAAEHLVLYRELLGGGNTSGGTETGP